MNTPVAFFIFNRPEPTARVFAEIARTRPPRLLVVADGPRADREGELQACLATRSVIETVDWPCDIQTNFADANLGCRARVSSGLDWVFEQTEEAIILEDDCLPHPTFFQFCEQLLDMYRDNQRLMAISGNNFVPQNSSGSYYYSSYPHIWGWASWRRAWNHYDVGMADWFRLRGTNWLQKLFGKDGGRFWTRVFDDVAAGLIDTWDLQWLFACLSQDGLSVTPKTNLVSNIGFGAASTHTGTATAPTHLATGGMEFPLEHPEVVIPNLDADRVLLDIYRQQFGEERISLMDRVLRRMRAAK